MIISIIAAMAENRVIGRGGAIPWNIPVDRRRFRELTMGNPLIMGRKTFESIGRPLAGRMNIILSRRPDYRAEGCCVAHSLDEALAIAADAGEVFICGGEELYRLALPMADRIYLTVVNGCCAGDACFPPVPADYIEMERSDAGVGALCTFILYQRKRIKPGNKNLKPLGRGKSEKDGSRQI
jgi:dihydrofolate reductase